MTTIYQFDVERIHTGASREIGDRAGVPPGWARGPLPALSGSQVARHSPVHGWVALDSRPAKPAAMLAAQRAAAWERIKALRGAVQAGGVQVGEKWYHTDTDSRVQQLALLSLGEQLPEIQWKTMDNSFVALTPLIVQQIFAASIAREQAVFTRAEVLRAAVMASDDPDSIDITGGWPARFEP